MEPRDLPREGGERPPAIIIMRKTKVKQAAVTPPHPPPLHRHPPHRTDNMGEDRYRFPVALLWDQGPESLKKYKNKLLLYFQKKSESKGGECEIRDTDCSRGYILIHFKEEAARDRVLKKSHEVKLSDGNPLKLTVQAWKSGDPQTGKSLPQSLDAAAVSPAAGILENSYKKNAQPAEISSVGTPDTTGAYRNEDVTSLPKHTLRDDSSTHSQKDEKQFDSSSMEHDSHEVSDKNKNYEGHASMKKNTETIGSSPGGAAASDGHEKSVTQPEALQHSDEFLGPVTFKFNDKTMNKTVREEIMERFSHLIKSKQECIELTGSFHELNLVWDYLRQRSGTGMGDSLESQSREAVQSFSQRGRGAQKKNFPESQSEEEMTSLSRGGRGAQKKYFPESQSEEEMQTDPQEGTREGNFTDTQSGQPRPKTVEDLLSVPSASCEYVMEIYQSDIEDIQRRYKVKIVHHSTSGGTTYIQVIPQGVDSLVDLAKQEFTYKVQDAMGDWSQEVLDSSKTQLPLDEIKSIVKSQWDKVLVITQDGRFILRGPKDQITQAKMLLEKRETDFMEGGTSKSTRHRIPVSVSNNLATEIPVDVRHLDILRKLKSRQISGIEQKYNVMMEEKSTNTKKGSVIITFRPRNGPPDLSAHAAHSFVVLLQKTVFNLKKVEIRLKEDYTAEHLHFLQEEMMTGGVDVIMERSGDCLCVIGHPLHVTFVTDRLSGVPEPYRAPSARAPGSDEEVPMDTSESSSAKKAKDDDDNKCPICLSEITEKEVLPKCNHAFCRGCLQQAMAHKPVCPICAMAYGEIRGNQPDGTMKDQTQRYDLPGYPGCGTIEISYNIPDGVQKENHPRPGKRFSGAHRRAYLPNNQEGREILRLLKKAFDQRLIFTVGESRTSGATDTVTWNDIHHKTSKSGGTENFGYPDPHYLKRVREELKAKGIE